MNKKGIETYLLNVIIGLIIAVILVFILLNLIGQFISPAGKGEEDTIYFYHTKLAKDLIEINLNEIKNLVFLTKKGFILISFPKEFDQIDIKNNECSYSIKEPIFKPVKCRDKNCLCICNSNPNLAGELRPDCNSQEAKCIEMPLKIKTSKCENFILYDSNEKLYNLETKKEKDSFIINTITSKAL